MSPTRREFTSSPPSPARAWPSRFRRDGAYDGPDNITVSPYGGLIVAEDGEGVQRLFGATDSGRTYPIARNELDVGTEEDPDHSEFAGVVFSPGGRTLYVSIQTPGVMFAITGPWKRHANRH